MLLGVPYFKSDPARIQTWNPHIRSVVLYSVELRGRLEGAKIQLYLISQTE